MPAGATLGSWSCACRKAYIPLTLSLVSSLCAKPLATSLQHAVINATGQDRGCAWCRPVEEVMEVQVHCCDGL